MKKRSQAREFAVQMMYQAEILDDEPLKIKEQFWKSMKMPPEDVAEFAEALFTAAYSHKDGHDQTVMQFLKDGWTFERLGEMEKCILRVAVDELLNSNTPAYAVLDEYVTLTKRFTDEKTASFVNGLLENIKNTFAK